ncbi:MAG: hypothetical protein NZZ60_04705 [Bacteroidia bacterium]|nr:hypothetical protein [Bacteroidia bacterium]MCX7651550.1 hypothetical protein [Bacteroidia bacterium]
MYAVLIVIIGKSALYSLRAQDTIGIYFSARGFSFDDYYRKAVLASEQEDLSGKAAFLLTLADTLASCFNKLPHRVALNLHRYPSYRSYIENPSQLPDGWTGLIYIQRLQLLAVADKAVFARSNRLHTERFYTLSGIIEGVVFRSKEAEAFMLTVPLPSSGWRQELIQSIIEGVGHFFSISDK